MTSVEGRTHDMDPGEREIFQKTNIFLVGLPGCGKSSVGPEIAAQTGMRFRDSDRLFEEWTGIRVPDYINDEGMEAFRDKESAVLELALTNTNQVIATGGGIVEKPGNLGFILRNGVMVYLEADIHTLIERVMNDIANNRPGLTGHTKEEVAEELVSRYRRRHEAFEYAPIRIKTDRIGTRHIATLIRQGVLRRKRLSSSSADTILK